MLPGTPKKKYKYDYRRKYLAGFQVVRVSFQKTQRYKHCGKGVVTVSKVFVTPVMLPGITKLRIRIRNTEVTVQRSGKRLVQRWPVVGGPIGKRSVRAAVSSGLQERRQPAVRESGSVQWSANNGG